MTKATNLVLGALSLSLAGLVTDRLLAGHSSFPRALPLLLALFTLVVLTMQILGHRRIAPRHVIAGAGLFVLGSSVLAAVPLISAVRNLELARTTLTSGLSAARSFNEGDADASFVATEKNAAKAEEWIDSALTLPARLLPFASSNIHAVRNIASGTRYLARAAKEAAGALRYFPRDQAGVPQIGMTNGRVEADSWQKAGPSLSRAVKSGLTGLARVQESIGLVIPPISDARKELLEKATQGVAAIEKSRDAAALIPLLVGIEETRRWLLIIQNPSELRGTGGLISGFGILKSDHGTIQLERLDSNISLPPLLTPVDAPDAFRDRYDRFGARTHWQSVNITPDFPTAAAQMMAMWKLQGGEAIDGVVAIDTVGISHLLKIVGPVLIPEIGEINAGNIIPFGLNEAYNRFPDKLARVDVLLEVARQVWTRILGGTYSDPRVLEPIVRASQERHLFIWGPQGSELFRRLSIDGTIKLPSRSSFLMTVGQNAAANKIDFYAYRSIKYRVGLEREAFRATLSIDIENRAPATGLPKYIAGPYLPADPPGLNRTYLSVYLEPSTGVDAASIDGLATNIESEFERGLSVASTFAETMPGKRSTTEFSLKGDRSSDGCYRLKVQHQPTVNPDNLTLEVVVPEGAVVTNMTTGMRVNKRVVTWKGKLTSDKEFSLAYSSSSLERLMHKLKGDDGCRVSRG